MTLYTPRTGSNCSCSHNRCCAYDAVKTSPPASSRSACANADNGWGSRLDSRFIAAIVAQDACRCEPGTTSRDRVTPCRLQTRDTPDPPAKSVAIHKASGPGCRVDFGTRLYRPYHCALKRCRASGDHMLLQSDRLSASVGELLAFRRRLGVPLVAAELGYRDALDRPDDAADVLIRLRGGDTLWQKERLLNVALRELPADCSAGARARLRYRVRLRGLGRALAGRPGALSAAATVSQRS